ncbi:MAG: porphobilinogen synthase [Planctomycetaceae bacterium]|nr:porphobilinogen synthase [Planctomycetaceae bacterium]
MRRLRIHPALREMLVEVRVHASDLIYPVFVRPGKNIRKAVPSMPGVFQYSADTLIKDLKKLEDQGLRAFMLFGVIDEKDKDESGSHILSQMSVVADTLRAIKRAGIGMLAAVDLCFCEYTSHGHCGIEDKTTGVDNRATALNLGKQAVQLAKAGADLIAPSGMMDGGVAAIRSTLSEAGYDHLPIMAYSVKYASAFYGPFRDAAASAPKHGDRRQYQQDPRRDRREAIEEAMRDVAEGADIVMVKPGLPYLDVLAELRGTLTTPLAAYHVSGEYAMLKAAAEKGWIDFEKVLMETLTSFKRAGASVILSYAAPDVLEILSDKS